MDVLLAVDGSVEADIARLVLSHLPLGSANFQVVMVTHLPVMAPGMALGPIEASEIAAADTLRWQRNVAHRTTERIAKLMRDEGHSAEAFTLEGSTAEVLLDRIQEAKISLVAVGSGRQSNLVAAFLGSVSRKLVLYSSASVLVGRRYSASNLDDTCRKLEGKAKLDALVAVDGSAGADLAIQALERLRTPAFRYLYVVAIQPVITGPDGLDLSAILPNYQKDLEQIKRIAESTAARLSTCAASVEPITAFGRPSTEITRIAGERGIDLVMLGASRHGVLERLLVGSCALEVATEAPCSVLVFRNVLPLEVQNEGYRRS